jgi:5-methylcytosine-specific restriction endonuclease McrA
MPRDVPATGRCALCHREVPSHLITLHHLHPKSRGGKSGQRTPLCKPCHKQLHATFSNVELEKLYPTLESLRAAAKLQPFLKWIRKQKPGRNFRTIQSTDHPEARRRR